MTVIPTFHAVAVIGIPEESSESSTGTPSRNRTQSPISWRTASLSDIPRSRNNTRVPSKFCSTACALEQMREWHKGIECICSKRRMVGLRRERGYAITHTLETSYQCLAVDGEYRLAFAAKYAKIILFSLGRASIK